MNNFKRIIVVSVIALVIVLTFCLPIMATDIQTRTYILSGGPDPKTNMAADDNLDIYLNGQILYKDPIRYGVFDVAPQRFSAKPGDIIRIVAYDYYGVLEWLSPIWLHDVMTGQKTKLTDGVPGQRVTKWGEVFFDQTFVIPNIDGVPPITNIMLDGTLGQNNWYTSNVQVTISATDNEGGSGVAKTEYSFDGINWTLYTESFTINTEGTRKLYYRSVDNAGNVEQIKEQVIKIDKTPPQLIINTPTDGGEYLFNQNILADWSADDYISGLASATGTVTNGQAVDTSTVGIKTFNVVAADNAGNQITKTVTYYVIYKYSGILPPVKTDGSSVFRLGSTVPVKFQLQDASGIFVNNAVAKLYVAKIDNGIVGEEKEAISTSAAATGNLFRYDNTENQYIFNLATKGLSAGTWQLRISLDDGTSKYVNISLK